MKKKFNRSELAQKVHASRNWCYKHTQQFWWVVPLQFWRYCYLQKGPIFLFWPWTIVHGHQKIYSIGIGSKIYASRDWCHIHVLQFWWVVPLRFRRYCYLWKWPIFPFWPWTIWLSKNLIDWNWLKTFMQVVIDVTYMHTNFGGQCLFGFGDIATYQNSQISLSVHGHQKI